MPSPVFVALDFLNKPEACSTLSVVSLWGGYDHARKVIVMRFHLGEGGLAKSGAPLSSSLSRKRFDIDFLNSWVALLQPADLAAILTGRAAYLRITCTGSVRRIQACPGSWLPTVAIPAGMQTQLYQRNECWISNEFRAQRRIALGGSAGSARSVGHSPPSRQLLMAAEASQPQPCLLLNRYKCHSSE